MHLRVQLSSFIATTILLLGIVASTRAEISLDKLKNKDNAFGIQGLKISHTELNSQGAEIGYGSYKPEPKVDYKAIVTCAPANSMDGTFKITKMISLITDNDPNASIKDHFPKTLAVRFLDTKPCFINYYECNKVPLVNERGIISLKPNVAETIFEQVVKVTDYMQARGWLIHGAVPDVCYTNGKVIFHNLAKADTKDFYHLQEYGESLMQSTADQFNTTLFYRLKLLYKVAYGVTYGEAYTDIERKYNKLRIRLDLSDGLPNYSGSHQDTLLERSVGAPHESRRPGSPTHAPPQYSRPGSPSFQ
ncbi:hypothetical protein BDF22DRAFT_664234 [Syncephalis plumigaleata]|nr:hypothetical protein BDF22DRAFT_664234 [Syncephalis plumigaleata]